MRIVLGAVLAVLLVQSGCDATVLEQPINPTPTAVIRLETDEEATDESSEPADGQDAYEQDAPESKSSDPQAEAPRMGPGGRGMGMGGMGMGGNGMRAFHMVPIPEEYAGLQSPVPASEDSIARGEPLYAQNCAICHGETGLGDGPTAASLDPAPPMIAMTSQMLGDDYMFWRISEGGAFEPFNSAMPAWKPVLSEQDRWDVINYVRWLGSGLQMGPGMGMGMGMNGNMEQMMRAEMLAAGMELGIITQEQAEHFDAVHARIDSLRAADPERRFTGTMQEVENLLLEELVASGDVTQEDADAYHEIHALLMDSAIMR